MKTYSDKITLVKNSRGCWDLDPIKGCKYGMRTNPNGCYDSCYAARLAKISGIDFSRSVKRYFKSANHLQNIVNKIANIDLPFIRLGTSGDPSEDWEHTLDICDKIKPAGKKIVVITKHWWTIPDWLLDKLCGIYVNTSVSALDSDEQIAQRLKQYERLKGFCYSILRVNTCDFNTSNIEGELLGKIQTRLLNNDNVLDTILRFSKEHRLVKAGIVNVNLTQYLKSKVYASVNNNKTYFGFCGDCPELCGIAM